MVMGKPVKAAKLSLGGLYFCAVAKRVARSPQIIPVCYIRLVRPSPLRIRLKYPRRHHDIAR